ncbi:FecR family protein [Halalkalibaculum sp. DA384]|uniref:FecR family protein n=1 Tax=Halalkalibaculum sp. DA384 TaxID=3373606 RepID=UPI003754EEED
MDDQLSHNDPDLELARQIGDLLEHGQSLESVDDPLIRELAAYRKRQHRSLAREPIDSEALWNRIHQATTRSGPAPAARIFSMPAVRWAAAAAILVAALSGILYLQFLQEPQLVAESASAVETVQLPDGSEVTLRPHSRLFSVSETNDQLLYKLSGEGYFEVITDPSRTFAVAAGRGRVDVLGTRFTVSSWGNRTQVFLEEGTVRFEGSSKTDALVLEPGQAAVLNQYQANPVLTEGSASEFTDWLRNELVFENRSAKRIFDEIEQHFGITISAPQNVTEMYLSGSLSLEDREKTLAYLGQTLDGRFRQTGERSYAFITNRE